MGERVEYDAGQPVLTGDWRVKEMLDMEPRVVMDELLSLAEAILDARIEYNEAGVELRQSQERLKLQEAEVLQVALDSRDEAVSGRNDKERDRKARIYLDGHYAIQALKEEVAGCEREEAEKRAAYEALVDRQKNLHAWARMYGAMVNLLATVDVGRGAIAELAEVSKAVSEAHEKRASLRFEKGGEEFIVVCKPEEVEVAREYALAEGYKEVVVINSLEDIERYVDSCRDALSEYWHKRLGSMLLGVTWQELVRGAQEAGFVEVRLAVDAEDAAKVAGSVQDAIDKYADAAL